MAYELIYTSAERGLRPGTRGFCTVAFTRGMPPPQVQLLEAMSAYKNLYGVHEESTAQEPVSWSHFRSNLAGRDATILSRVGPMAADHTGRTNKLAHHVLVHARERAPGGPVWVSRQPGFFVESWAEPAHYLEMPKAIPQGDGAAGKAVAWEALTGDAGHAASLAEAYLANTSGIVLVIFAPGMDLLPLLGEAMALLPAAVRWQVTYSTYFTGLPAGATCSWRCCVAGSVVSRETSRLPRVTTLDLTAPLPPAPGGRLADLARHGRPAGPVREPSAEAPPVPAPPARPGSLSSRRLNMLNLKPRKPES
ncbi:MAG: hypothetical protein PHC30_01750 [Lentisphaeria bacterium]|jgi:hypothetical protein|nr:hypothetical protein [Lentisphaeria bacterium]